MTSIDELLGSVELPTGEITLCVNGPLLAEWNETHGRWRRASDEQESLGSVSEKQQLAEQIRALDERIKQATAVIKIKALPGSAWYRLKSQHPSRDADGQLDFNGETFPPATLAACATDPVMTPEQASSLFEKLTEGQRSQVFYPVLALNQGTLDIPFDAAVYERTQPGDS